jgi:hypothetical protein
VDKYCVQDNAIMLFVTVLQSGVRDVVTEQSFHNVYMLERYYHNENQRHRGADQIARLTVDQ